MSLLPLSSLHQAGFHSAAFTLLALCALAVACGDATYSDDTPCQSDAACASDERCVLEEDTQGTCQPVSGANGEEEPAPANNSGPAHNNGGPVNNSNPPPLGGSYRFVMIEDASLDNLNGATPGADIDAIGVDVDGDFIIDYWASTIDDFNINGNNNEYIDVESMLGPPDSDCMVRNFTSLGGGRDDSYVIVSFGNRVDVTFSSGAIVQVWELGPTNCPNQSSWKDDENTLSVSLSNDRSTFEQIGTVGTGTNAVIIP